MSRDDQPGTSHSPAIPDRSAQDVLALGRGEQLPSTDRTPMHEAVTELARSHPDRPAVRCGEATISYGELDAWAGQVATRLAEAGVARGDRVGVYAEPSTAMVAAVVGVLRAGAAYVPVDPIWPGARIAEVFDDARASAVVVTGGAADRVAGLGLPVIPLGDAAPAEAATTCGPVVTDTDPAYLIYTSGSTGEPKGVLVTHGQLAASTLARRLVYPRGATFLLVSPLAFDSSVAGLWGTLAVGDTLVVATRDEVRDAERLVELVRRHRITRTLCVPSLYGVLLDAAERIGSDALASLDMVIVAGEPLPEALVARHFAQHARPVALVNEYGPSETTVWASYHRFDGPGPVSIGRPVPGTLLYVLDDDLRPVPGGAEGELFIGGANVSSGYFGRPDATARSFLSDPFAGGDGRMYRTGDRVRWSDDGRLIFVGRRDHQVKIRGHRVELGAVEAALRTVAGVRDAVVVPNGARTTLIGFIQADQDSSPDLVKARLADLLPAPMVPTRIRVLEHFPLTFSGKVDRVQLATAADEELVSATPTEPASNAGTVASVAAAWAEVLGIPEVSGDANFFDLGGHSLAMFRLQDALERHTGVRPSVVALFQHTTVAAQAALISAGGGGRARSVLPDRAEAVARRARVRARRQSGAGVSGS